MSGASGTAPADYAAKEGVDPHPGKVVPLPKKDNVEVIGRVVSDWRVVQKDVETPGKCLPVP